MPKINTSVDGLILHSDHAFDFLTKPISLTVDPMIVSDDSKVNMANSMIIKEMGSKLTPNCEPFVPTESLEQASTGTSSGHDDCDVKLFDPNEFHEKWKNKPPMKPHLKPVDLGSGARPKAIRAKPIKPKGVIKKVPIVPSVPKSVMVWVPISH
ncbi:hypothetical protein R6Q57_018508 [Mikania cordata]